MVLLNVVPQMAERWVPEGPKDFATRTGFNRNNWAWEGQRAGLYAFSQPFTAEILWENENLSADSWGIMILTSRFSPLNKEKQYEKKMSSEAVCLVAGRRFLMLQIVLGHRDVACSSFFRSTLNHWILLSYEFWWSLNQSMATIGQTSALDLSSVESALSCSPSTFLEKVALCGCASLSILWPLESCRKGIAFSRRLKWNTVWVVYLTLHN